MVRVTSKRNRENYDELKVVALTCKDDGTFARKEGMTGQPNFEVLHMRC